MLSISPKGLVHLLQRRGTVIILEGLVFTPPKEAATLNGRKLFLTVNKGEGMLGHVCLVGYWLSLQA